MKPIVAVVGPTAIGKSALALHLAKRFQGEIVSADSRQIYRFMNIGTAKPSLVERSAVPHHLIDIVNPDESFSLALFRIYSEKVIKQIHSRRNLPLLVGGSGLYVWSILEGWRIPNVKPDYKLRNDLQKRAALEGNYALYQELYEADPASAVKMVPNNIQRIIRALEIYIKTGKPASKLWEKKGCDYPFLVIGLTTERSDLYHKIDSRVDTMIREGFIDEVKSIMEMGYKMDLPSMSSVGYRQIGMFLGGNIDLRTSIQQIKHNTHRIARHQYAWFRLSDERIHWQDINSNIITDTEKIVQLFLKQQESLG